MSIRPLLHDPDFGYVTDIVPGRHYAWGQEIAVNFADGRTITLGANSIGGAMRNRVTKYLAAQTADGDE